MENLRRDLVWLAAAMLVAGCSTADPVVTASTPAATTITRPASAPAPSASESGDGPVCAHDIGGIRPAVGAKLILDAVVLPTETLQAEDAGQGWRFAKQGLLVRANTTVEISITSKADSVARIGWGSPGPVGTTIRVPACPSSSGWLAFAGGYSVRKPMCVPLLVRANGREQSAAVGVGKAC